MFRQDIAPVPRIVQAMARDDAAVQIDIQNARVAASVDSDNLVESNSSPRISRSSSGRLGRSIWRVRNATA